MTFWWLNYDFLVANYDFLVGNYVPSQHTFWGEFESNFIQIRRNNFVSLKFICTFATHFLGRV